MNFLAWCTAAALGMALVALQAVAHEAISGWTYPGSCCSAMDCYHLEPGEVTWTPDGYRIEATGEVIPFDDTRRSPDAYFHRCSSGGDPAWETKGKGFRKGWCLWAPEAGT